MRAAYLLIAHGSRDAEANRAFFEFLEKFRHAYSHRKVEGAFLELAKPGILEGIENCIRAGADEIFVIPLMFFPGRHVKEDIPRLIQESRAKHPNVDFHYAGPLSDHPDLLPLLEGQAKSLEKKHS